MLLALALSLSLQSTPPLSRVDALTLAAFAQDRGDFAAARAAHERALLLGPPRPTQLYHLAQCCAAQADLGAAAAHLLAAAGAGLREPDLASDPALAGLHEHPLWSELVATVGRAAEEYERSIRLPSLRRELLQRMEQDQLARERMESLPMEPGCDGPGHAGADGADGGEVEVVTFPADGAEPACVGSGLEAIDRDNTRRMREIVAEHGWPTRSLVGEDGAQAAWLLVQHADLDPDFQLRCLELMRATPAGEVAPDHLAYLSDRVAVNAGRPQEYGTQFRFDGERMAPAPLREPETVDERRRAMGLCSLALYAEHFRLDHPR